MIHMMSTNSSAEVYVAAVEEMEPRARFGFSPTRRAPVFRARSI
jgi:hypothetical protein